MNSPGGVVATDSIAYIADTGNNRLLAVSIAQLLSDDKLLMR